MMTSAITVQDLGKKYILSHEPKGSYSTMREAITDKVKNAFSSKSRISSTLDEDFWALSNVSFQIEQGDKVGIIGRNGAGKSTLLKILSRITEPTTGEIKIRGRVASLLEVGTGFHPELTGRENIFLNGSIMGMSKYEIKKKFDEIVDFAEVERFLDTPVKRYSSGMYVRLAFAVAAHLEPEILIVDEVLAVGDAQFQKKCMGKMNSVGKDGKTVIFVSHNMTAVKSLCDKAIWLEKGSLKEIGSANNIIENYLQKGLSTNMTRFWEFDSAPGNADVRLHSVKVENANNTTDQITVQTAVKLSFKFWSFDENASLNFSVVLYDNQEICIFNTVSQSQKFPKGIVEGSFVIPENFLNDGFFRVRLLVVKDKSIPLCDVDNVATFEVADAGRDGAWYGKWIGAVRPKFQWETLCIKD